MMTNENWFDENYQDFRKQNAYNFSIYLINTVKDIEKENNISNKFSRYLEKELNCFLMKKAS